MGYDIAFKVKVDGTDRYIPVGECWANITWNVGEMIRESTGLPWHNEKNNGLCVDIIPKIIDGYNELLNHPDKYRKFESQNGWGTVEGTIHFFKTIIDNWHDFMNKYPDLIKITTFWIE